MWFTAAHAKDVESSSVATVVSARSRKVVKTVTRKDTVEIFVGIALGVLLGYLVVVVLPRWILTGGF